MSSEPLDAVLARALRLIADHVRTVERPSGEDADVRALEEVASVLRQVADADRPALIALLGPELSALAKLAPPQFRSGFFDDPEWFGVRSFYRFEGRDDHDDPRPYYEERVVLFKADTFAEAVARAEAESEEYADVFDDCQALGCFQAFAIADDVRDGAEIYSLMRSSTLEPDDYLDHFFDTGDERQGLLG